MASFWVWGLALLGYAAFLGWYVNWRGPLSKAEIESLMAQMMASNVGHGDQDEMPVIRRFLEEDDGREFFMLNVIRLSETDVEDPDTGELRPVRQVMAGYTRMFMPALFARGGHPALAARRIGGMPTSGSTFGVLRTAAVYPPCGSSAWPGLRPSAALVVGIAGTGGPPQQKQHLFRPFRWGTFLWLIRAFPMVEARTH